MSGLPSTAALRNAAVACVAGAGLALVGLSLSNVAAIDGTLAAATAPPVVSHNTQISWDGTQKCPRGRHHAPPASGQQY